MKYLFSPLGLKILDSLSYTKTLYAFDYDGTLSPIVKDPESAKMSSLTEDLLNQLSQKVPVAVISGRSIKDLKEQMSFKPQYLVGNHGLEGISFRKESANQALKACEKWKKQLGKPQSFDNGIYLEDKMYSLALHYRKSRNKKLARIKLYEKIEKLDPNPRLVLGKCVMNLIPTGAPHKGVALLELMMSLNYKCALYIGDDDTDEDVFSLPDSNIFTVRVGKKINSQAQYYIERQSEINNLIKKIIIRVSK